MSRDPRRRNRNIGTARQGHGRDNLHVVPSSSDQPFHQVLNKPVRFSRTVAGGEIRFAVERPIRGFFHHCTVEDIVRLLAVVPPADWEEIRSIVLRQPTRRQNLLRPVWGRVVFGRQDLDWAGSAIHLDAQNPTEKIRWPISLHPETRLEIRRMAADGHQVVRDRRYWNIRPNSSSIRNTQLYHTLLHEIGHFRDRRRWSDSERYFRRCWRERETRAARYATTINTELRRNGLIPFDRMQDDETMRADGLDPQWFVRSVQWRWWNDNVQYLAPEA